MCITALSGIIEKAANLMLQVIFRWLAFALCYRVKKMGREVNKTQAKGYCGSCNDMVTLLGNSRLNYGGYARIRARTDVWLWLK